MVTCGIVEEMVTWIYIYFIIILLCIFRTKIRIADLNYALKQCLQY